MLLPCILIYKYLKVRRHLHYSRYDCDILGELIRIQYSIKLEIISTILQF